MWKTIVWFENISFFNSVILLRKINPSIILQKTFARVLFKSESLSQELFTNFTELRTERVETDAVLEAWIQEIEPEMLLTPMRYRNLSKAKEREHPLWFAIAHLFNHQTHHRGQITTLLNQMGGDYGVTDFLAMYELVGISI